MKKRFFFSISLLFSLFSLSNAIVSVSAESQLKQTELNQDQRFVLDFVKNKPIFYTIELDVVPVTATIYFERLNTSGEWDSEVIAEQEITSNKSQLVIDISHPIQISFYRVDPEERTDNFEFQSILYPDEIKISLDDSYSLTGPFVEQIDSLEFNTKNVIAPLFLVHNGEMFDINHLNTFNYNDPDSHFLELVKGVYAITIELSNNTLH